MTGLQISRLVRKRENCKGFAVIKLKWKHCLCFEFYKFNLEPLSSGNILVEREFHFSLIHWFIIPSYPICVFPIPGAPQNSVIFPTGTPPPNISSSCSQKVTMLPYDCSCSKMSYAFLLPGTLFDEVVWFVLDDCCGSVVLRTVWIILRASSLSKLRSVDRKKRWDISMS